MILGKNELEKLLAKYHIVKPLRPDSIKSVHIDLRLGRTLGHYTQLVNLHDSTVLKEESMDSEQGYRLASGGFVIGHTFEEVYIPPGYWGFIETKGNIARAGLSAHNTDGHIDPGYRGTLTLEIKNQNTVPVIIYPEMPFVQLFIFEVNGDTPPYDGKYQLSHKPTSYIPD